MVEETSVRRQWFVLGTTALGAFVGALMFTSVNVALPSLMVALDAEFNVAQWVVLSYLLATGTLLPIVGRLADMVGKKSLYLWGYVIFTLGSLLCGLAPSVVTLILFRMVQGFGSAFLTALSLAIISDTFPASERGRAIGINGSILSTGIVLGPTAGGLLVDVLSWRWIFLLIVPLGLAGLLLSQRFIPRYQAAGSQRFDLPGAAILFLGLLSLLLALTFGQDYGFGSAGIVALFAASALLLLLFLGLELRVADPIIDLRLFRNPQLSIGLVTGFVTFISISGTIFLMPFYLENILGYAPRNVGLLMSVVPVAMVIVAPLAGRWADRYGERPVTVVGMVLLLIGYLALGTLSSATTALGYVLRFLSVGLGMAIFQTPNNSAIMGAVPRTHSGVAGGLLALTRTLGSTSGIAVLGTLWAVRVIQLSRAQDATRAPVELQVAGLHHMFLFIQIGVLLALLLTIWDLFMRRRARADAGNDVAVTPSD